MGGATQVMKGNLTIGQLVAFNALLAYFLGPMKNIINLQPMLQTAIVAAERLGEILDLEIEQTEDETKKMQPQSLRGTVEFRDVTFRYGTRKTVLEDISIHIKPGEKIAYVPQETFLFSGSIYDNLVLGQDDMDLEKVVAAAKMAKAHDFINDFPLRYNSRLEENESNLSGGQRQRLSITRAILKNPDLLILDEATSNLDSITEKTIERTIEEYTKDIYTIIIAHRLSTIKRCDKIYVMEDGRIIESGNHKELMLLQGRYHEMWKEQGIESMDKIEELVESVS